MVHPMLESDADLARLQETLDASHAHAGPQLKRIFDSERASAADIVQRLTGVFEIHLATLTGDGAPLVAPVDALFFKGKLWCSLAGQSVRAKLVPRDPRVSASYTDGSFAVIVHGTARPFTDADPDFAEIDAKITASYVSLYGRQWTTWRDFVLREQGPGYSFWIEPRVMFAKR